MLSVRLATGEWAELIDVSSGGALVRAHGRPPMDPLKHVRPDPEPAGGLVFRLAQGEKIHVAGRVVRCQVASLTQGSLLYGVAFRFDDPLSLDLPSDPPLQFPADSLDADMSIGVAQAHAQGDTRLTGDLFNDLTRTSQNRANWLADRDFENFGDEEQALLARLPGDVWLPDGVREAVAQLALVSAELFQLQTEGFNACHTSPALPDLASLGARIRELNYLRDELVERIYRGCGPRLEPQEKLPQVVAPAWAPESAPSLAATSYVGTYNHPAFGEATVAEEGGAGLTVSGCRRIQARALPQRRVPRSAVLPHLHREPGRSGEEIKPARRWCLHPRHRDTLTSSITPLSELDQSSAQLAVGSGQEKSI